MRPVGLICLCFAASLFGLFGLLGGGGARAANDVRGAGDGLIRIGNDGSFRIGEWTGRAYFTEIRDNKKLKEKRLDRCAAQLTNPEGISLIYSLDSHYMWTFELANPSWNFPKGSAFDVSFGNRDRGFFRQRVAALEPQLVRVLLADSLNSFEVFRRLFKLEIVAGGMTTQFDLTLANPVLVTLTRCVMKFGTTAKSKAALAAYLKSPIGPAAEASSDAAILQETAALAAGIVAEGEIAKAAAAKPDEVPDGVSGDAVWKVGDNLFTVSVLPQDEVPAEIGDLNDLIVGAGAQRCRGDFFAGTMLDVVEGATVARAYTSCQTQQATTSTYHFAMPRRQGGLYFVKAIATGVEVPPAVERALKELDGRIRAAIMLALAKM
ncbi:MAG TPA: hypothetical protein VFB29_13290 [Pseudolabrys sp.]|nr:hypothetical protein [Pseudolabrys sp.]